MANISFNEPQYGKSMRPGGRRSSLANTMIKMGFAKDDAGAQRALAVAAVLIAVLAVGVYIYGNPSPAPVDEALMP